MNVNEALEILKGEDRPRIVLEWEVAAHLGDEKYLAWFIIVESVISGELLDTSTELEKLKSCVRSTVPYVTATINPHFRWKGDWCEIHRGRAFSSLQQLEHLEKMANTKSPRRKSDYDEHDVEGSFAGPEFGGGCSVDIVSTKERE